MASDCGLGCPVLGGFYSYHPSVGGNAALLAAFVLLALVCIYFGFRLKTFAYSATLATGLVLEVLGFIGRILLQSARGNRGYFFLSLFGTVLGPTVMSAAISIVLPNVLGIYREHVSPPRPLVIGLIFWILGTIVLVVELIGLCFVAFDSKKIDQGTSIAAAGMGVQTLSLASSSVLYFWLILGYRAGRAHADTQCSQMCMCVDLKRFLISAEVATALLVVSSIYRTAELAGGVLGVLFQSQVAFMVAGAAIPCLAGLLLVLFHPGFPFVDATWTANEPCQFDYHSQPEPGTPRSPVQSILSMQSPGSTTYTHELAQSPKGYPMHHRYDPDIRNRLSQISPKDTNGDPARRSVGPPGAAYQGLPAHPRSLVRSPSLKGRKQVDEELDDTPKSSINVAVPLRVERARQGRPTPLDLSKKERVRKSSLTEKGGTPSEQLVKDEELW